MTIIRDGCRAVVGDVIPHMIENGGNKVEGKKEEEWVRELPASILVAELVQKVTAGKIFGVCPGDKPVNSRRSRCLEDIEIVKVYRATHGLKIRRNEAEAVSFAQVSCPNRKGIIPSFSWLRMVK